MVQIEIEKFVEHHLTELSVLRENEGIVECGDKKNIVNAIPSEIFETSESAAGTERSLIGPNIGHP